MQPNHADGQFDRPSAAVQVLTIAVCALAMLVAVVAVEADNNSQQNLIIWLCVSSFAVLLGGWLGRVTSYERVVAWAAPGVFIAYTANVVAEPVIRGLGYGRALELVLYEGLLVTLPVFAFASGIRRWVSLAGTASLFTVLFAVCLLATSSVGVLAAIWALVAVAWLTTMVRDSAAGEQIEQSSSRRPWMLFVPLALVALGIASVASGRDSLSLSNGFLWSSGGDGEGSEFARSGVGDGNALVAATKHVESFGPIEDAPFAQSHDPSLYDLFDNTYGDTQPVKNSDRAVSLKPEDVLEGDNHLVEAEAANREFSTLRKPRKSRRGNVGRIDSAAMFYVAGRVPLHLKLQVFEVFDGIKWTSIPLRENHIPRVQFETVDDEPWLIVPQPSEGFDDLFGIPEAHALKPVHFDETRIPMPPNATAVHIDKVDRADLFEWVQEDVVRMKRKRLAKMVPIHVSSRRLDPEVIADVVPSFSFGGRHEFREVPSHPQMDEVRALAKEWTKGAKTSWDRVQQLVGRLREHAVLDRDAVASADSDFPVGEFLFETKRGPDYQFATAACLMLRSLGFSSRVVAGFYADPEKYDAEGRHTFVDGEDVHTWCEVRLGGRCWATVEPTPGYEVLLPRRSVWYHTKVLLWQVATGVAQRWHLIAIAAVLALVVWWRRVELVDLLWSVRLRIPGREPEPQDVWRLVEHRLDAVCPAPPGHTPRSRIDHLPAPTEVKSMLFGLVSEAESGAYGGAAAATKRPDEHAIAPDFLQQITLRQLRRWKREEQQQHESTVGIQA